MKQNDSRDSEQVLTEIPVSEELLTQEEADAAAGARRKHLFQPGKSGNPSGRPKRTKEEKDALEAIKALAPDAAKKLGELLKSTKTSSATKVKICELILDRTYGKSESAVKLTTVQQTVEQSQDYVLSLVERIREGMKND